MSSVFGGAASVLALRLDPEAGPQVARLELFDAGSSLSFLHVGLAELGFAASTSSHGYEAADPARTRPPERVIDAIASVVASHVGRQLPLYLRFSRPTGGLPLLPWERWLSPAVGAPIVRLPYLPVPSAPGGEELEVAICASAAHAKGEFDPVPLVSAVLEHLGELARPVRAHVFVDVDRARQLSSALAQERVAVSVVPAESAAPYGIARRSEGLDDEQSSVESPWLRWVLAEAPPRLDLVVFVCHGYLANGRGSLAFAESPLENRDPRWARFVGRRQLVSFLDACGARALALLSPPANWNVSGLLGLADEVARQRPGPVLFHDFEADPSGRALGGVLPQLLGSAPSSWPFQEAPSIALYASADLLDDSVKGQTSTGTGSGTADRVLEVHARRATRQTGTGLGTGTGTARTRGVRFGTGTGAGTGTGTGTGTVTGTGPGAGTGTGRGSGMGMGGGTGTGATSEERAQMGAERWKAASQRLLERHAAALATQPEADSSAGRAAQEGRARALSFLAEVVDRSDSGDE